MSHATKLIGSFKSWRNARTNMDELLQLERIHLWHNWRAQRGVAVLSHPLATTTLRLKALDGLMGIYLLSFRGRFRWNFEWTRWNKTLSSIIYKIRIAMISNAIKTPAGVALWKEYVFLLFCSPARSYVHFYKFPMKIGGKFLPCTIDYNPHPTLTSRNTRMRKRKEPTSKLLSPRTTTHQPVLGIRA